MEEIKETDNKRRVSRSRSRDHHKKEKKHKKHRNRSSSSSSNERRHKKHHKKHHKKSRSREKWESGKQPKESDVRREDPHKAFDFSRNRDGTSKSDY
jgi:hypothetical protein